MKSPRVANAWNTAVLEEQYEKWAADPRSVDSHWRAFCEGFTLSRSPAESKYMAQTRVAELIRAYRNLGHLQAQINPLAGKPPSIEDLRLSNFHLTLADLEKSYFTGNYLNNQQLPLKEIITLLEKAYCGSVGYEYAHIQNMEKRRYLQRHIEQKEGALSIPSVCRQRILHKMIEAEVFEQFLHERFTGKKRFSLEGSESLIAALDTIVEYASNLGFEEIVMGMSHRGRINVSANIMGKPYSYIFSEFGSKAGGPKYGDGDVKYHLGYACIATIEGKPIEISLLANPSHLESVNPVVVGKARARQRSRNDAKNREKVLPLLVHGDAAFAGQGVVAETLNLSNLPGYTTGGTLHLIVNNQIGFTANPKEFQSSHYCTDIAKTIEVPIFHVNGEDPEAVCAIVKLGLLYRQKFSSDVVVDICCYRKRGHNEVDEPNFTQPLLYQKINQRPLISRVFFEKIKEKNTLTEDRYQALLAQSRNELKAAWQAFEKGELTGKSHSKQVFKGSLGDFHPPYSHKACSTQVPQGQLRRIMNSLTTVPKGFSLNSKILRQLTKKKKHFEAGGPVDWALAEAFALGSVILDGHATRLSGQDSERGTFSQRHASWYDAKTNQRYLPLESLGQGRPCFCVYNSSLSEAGVLGFDLGYSLGSPDMLIIWEAQFGDFANGAQVHIDQYICSSESKWGIASSLVMLLPHGYEGQGPEHSNARLERYLQACAQDNIQVAMLSTPAQYFHILRRQVLRAFRKPLILLTPKSLLRHKLCVSQVADFTHARFQEFIDDAPSNKQAKRLIFCSGKVYYDLLQYRATREIKDNALIRVEQFYPFHAALFRRITQAYKKHNKIIWCQEEPQNMGAWDFMRSRLEEAFLSQVLYVGRPPAASPACGSEFMHQSQQEKLVESAFAL